MLKEKENSFLLTLQKTMLEILYGKYSEARKILENFTLYKEAEKVKEDVYFLLEVLPLQNFPMKKNKLKKTIKKRILKREPF